MTAKSWSQARFWARVEALGARVFTEESAPARRWFGVRWSTWAPNRLAKLK
jgi:hypothetical protein